MKSKNSLKYIYKLTNKLFNLFFSFFDQKVLKVPGGYFGVDSYPRLNIYKRMTQDNLFERNLSDFEEKIDRVRRFFWKEISKSHPPFASCYFKNYRESLNNNIREIQKYGFTVIENFLPNHELEILTDEINKLEHNMLQKPIKGINYGYENLSQQSQDFINRQLEVFNFYFFGKGFKPTIQFNLIKSNDGIEPNISRSTSLWHADRFIPCINGLYFPSGCSWMPFERIITSPLIENDVKAKFLQNHYKDINQIDKNAKTYKSICPKNTLIIGFHHIFHRRTPISSPGKRSTIFISWYDSFSRFSLIKSFIKNKILNKLFNN